MNQRFIRSFLFFFIGTLVSNLSCGQSSPFYETFACLDSTSCIALAEKRKAEVIEFYRSAEPPTRKYRKQFEALAMNEATGAYHTARYLTLHDTIIQPYVQSVFYRLVQGDDHLAGSRVIVIRSPALNAYASPHKTVVITVGLLGMLENEEQLAFLYWRMSWHI